MQLGMGREGWFMVVHVPSFQKNYHQALLLKCQYMRQLCHRVLRMILSIKFAEFCGNILNLFSFFLSQP